jgi:hypothetical protein
MPTARQLYDALVTTIKRHIGLSVLTALADLRAGLTWDQVSAKTRSLFDEFLANLTNGKPQG